MPIKHEIETTKAKTRKSKRTTANKNKTQQQQITSPTTRRKMYYQQTKQSLDKASRLCLPSWLEEQISSEKYRGLKWMDRGKMTFTVPWKHASRHGWNQNEDAKIFKAWASYTGVYKEGNKLSSKYY